MKRLAVMVLVSILIPLTGQGQAQPSAPPEMVTLAENLVAQIDRALQEASFAWVATTYEDVQAGSQRVLNLLVGRDSPDFRPIVGDAEDTIGVMTYAAQLKAMLQDTPWNDFVVTASAVETFAGWATERAKAVVELVDKEQGRVEIHKAEAFLKAAQGCAGAALPTAGGARSILAVLNRL